MIQISVALCTCNGEAYLPMQLASIAAQTLLPFELVISDDASTDGTPVLLAEFAKSVPFPVRIHRNPRRLGVTANFQQVMRACRGEVLVLCDQDDWWLPHKLVTLLRPFDARSDLALVFSDADLVDQDGAPLGRTLWDHLGFNGQRHRQLRRDPLGALLRCNPAYGLTMALRRSYLDRVLPIPPHWSHDSWPAMVLAATASVALVGQPLVCYRQHPRQQEPNRLCRKLGPTDPGANRYREQISRFRLLRRRLEREPSQTQHVQRLDDLIHHYHTRDSLPVRRMRRAGHTLPDLLAGRYHRHSKGFRAWAKDLFLM
jgi:glycosyltransferase involved in cell wall biosynthesis